MPFFAFETCSARIFAETIEHLRSFQDAVGIWKKNAKPVEVEPLLHRQGGAMQRTSPVPLAAAAAVGERGRAAVRVQTIYRGHLARRKARFLRVVAGGAVGATGRGRLAAFGGAASRVDLGCPATAEQVFWAIERVMEGAAQEAAQ